MTASTQKQVIFDLGGVLIDWHPRYLYRKFFGGDEQAMRSFLDNVCTEDWHHQHDLGVPFAESAPPLIGRHPDKAELIRAWGERFEEMFGGIIEGTVAVLDDLRKRRTPLYVLSNWPADDFPKAEKRYPFLSWFDGKVVSGFERIAKPDPRIYQLLVERYNLDPEKAVFIDDRDINVKAAQALGFTGIRFTSPQDLRVRLQTLDLLPEVA